ncbi:MAG: hypothetical protein WB622_21755 [Acidobacteriaceae bacterium]
MAIPRVPRRGERVRVDGQMVTGTLVVVRVDQVNSIAKIERWDDPRSVLWNIPFDAIHLVREPESEAA